MRRQDLVDDGFSIMYVSGLARSAWKLKPGGAWEVLRIAPYLLLSSLREGLCYT